MYYARYVIKGENDIKKNHDYVYAILILRQVFDAARDGGDDWLVEDRFYYFYKGKKIE